MRVIGKKVMYLSHSDQLARRRKLFFVFRNAMLCVVVVGAIVACKLLISHSSSRTLTPSIVNSAPSSAPVDNKPQPTNAGGSQLTKPVVAFVSTKQTPVVSPAPNCTPHTSIAPPAPVQISASQTGLHQNPISTNYYTIYGNSVSQISNQINSCTPVSENGSRFAASTDYVINWVFNVSGDEQGLCTVSQASVGLGISETLPSWQASPSAVSGLSTTWSNFISSLMTHESGHAQLSQIYAANILNDLQNFPPTDCVAVVAAANAKASADLAALNQANISYDLTTNHGASQGAVLVVR